MRLARGVVVAFAIALLPPASASATVVKHGYLPLKDGTQLSYTLTLPRAEGHYPVVMQYDPYAAGAASDPTWNDDGYAMLGVNFRGTGCSTGTFNMVRGDIWGKDGAEAVDWAATQPWSTGKVAMLGFSFTGTSQIATAAYAGPALKAIMPGNVFPDLYRDISYPGGVYNSLDPAWIVAGRQFVVGTNAVTQGAGDPNCDLNEAQQLAPNDAQTFDTTQHPWRDDYWAHDPESLARRVHIPILGCVNWQDMTVYSRAFNEFRDHYNPATTWVVGGDGQHTDCPIARARRVRFLDHYLKGADNGWEESPHLLLVHEYDKSPGRDKVPDNAGWQTSFAKWSDVSDAINPLSLWFRAGGRLDLAAPTKPETADSYTYRGAQGVNKPEVYSSLPVAPGSQLTYTTGALTHDVEFLGSGSANLWLASTATDTDVQLAVSEVRPDGQEEFVANGWLELSHRKLDPAGTSVLRPQHPYLQADAQSLTPGTPVFARAEIQPFDHVFRKGSAIRVSIDAPASSLVAYPAPATNTVEHTPGMESGVVLGQLPGARAPLPLPACDALLNQPCRANAEPVTATTDIPEPSPLPAQAASVPKSVVWLLGRPRVRSRSGASPALVVTARAVGGSLRRARLSLTTSRGTRVAATATRLSVGARSRTLLIPLEHALRPGRYTLRVTGMTVDGRPVVAMVRFRVRARRG
jgi:putative CocE/NonD family hydrolase